ncbi:glutamyl-tRNA amidotransferase [Parcubacteria bacterium SG8_24]|nr:MAG: glutamyl-tRNA amidotransferase [Parcubacteria bacterium SG8_24]
MDIMRLNLTDIADGFRRKEWSSREITETCLDQAERAAGETHAYVELSRDRALTAAAEADGRYAAGRPLSAVDGVPLGIKDCLLVAGAHATAASAILKDYLAPYDATAVSRLRQAGAVFLGKTNMDEFAMGSTTETSCHGPSRNPWDTSRIPGGSSGGSAVAVAEGSAVAALGSDTGGSVRQPAAMCGIVGFKPTYGRVSRYGLIAMASSLDQVSPITRSVTDAAILLRVMEGHDPRDATSVPLKLEWSLPESFDESLRGLRIGLPAEYFVSGLDPQVERTVREAISRLEDLGAEIREISLPHTEYALAVYYIIMPCEVSANLARFDGIRYGRRVSGADLEDTYRRSRGQGFGKEVRRRIILGTYALSSGYYDAYYLRAMKVRRLIANDFARAFDDVDCIVTPTVPTTAWKLGEKLDDPLAMYLSDVYTVSANVAGLPAISIPCGLVDGLPVGLQIMGRHFDDKTVLGTAYAYEKAYGGPGRFAAPR